MRRKGSPGDTMRKSLTALSVATTIAVAAVVTPTTADAHWRSWGTYPYYGYGYGPYYAYSAYYYGRYGPPPDGYHYVYVPRHYYRVRRPVYGY